MGLNTPIVVSFNERLNPLTVNSSSIALYDTTTGQLITATTSFSTDGKTVTLTPTAPLSANRQYYVYISNWAYPYDQAGNRVNWTYWYFTTGSVTDLEKPVISGSNIADGVTDIAVNSNLRFVLDEAVSSYSVDGSVHLQVNGIDVAGTTSLGSDNRTLTFTPAAALTVNTAYSVVVNGLYDYIGNKLAAVTSHFTTGSTDTADTAAPSVAIAPSYGAADVSVNTPISLTFSEAIDPTTLDSGINISANGFSGELAGSFSINGNIVTFSPLSALPGNTQITVYVNGVLDLAGNASNWNWTYFNTGTGGDTTPPTLDSITPTDGAMDVGSNNPIVLTFSKSLNQSTVNASTIGLFVNGSIVRPSISYSGDSRTVTLTTNLAASSLVTVLLTNDIKDLSGNRLTDTVKVFTTAAVSNDTSRPSITTALPGSGAYNVLSKNKVVLYSNKPMNAGSLQGALHVSQNGVLINGALQVIGDGRTLVFTPAQAWRKDALIEVFLDSTAQDQSGNALNSYHGSFRIEEDSAQKAPYVLAVNTDDGISMPLNPVIDLQ
ncbi:MAG: Ig-like domain-containing protein, partial [Methylococcaceae bacterium]